MKEDEDAVLVKEEADRVLENYCRRKVKDILYQLRVDAVKMYYDKQGEVIDDTLARPRELEYEQYLDNRVEWCNEEAWPQLCRYWCSQTFKKKRKIGQESRLKSADIAQNHGGSRPFVETQQFLVCFPYLHVVLVLYVHFCCDRTYIYAYIGLRQ